MAFLFRRAQQPGGPAPPPPPPPPPPPQPPSFPHYSASPPVSDLIIEPASSANVSGNKGSDNALSAGSDVMVQNGTLATVARSIRHCVSGMSPWDISDLTLGLYKIATRHAREGVSDSIEGSFLAKRQELEEILYWLDWAWASYLADEKAIVEFLKIQKQQLKKLMNTSSILKPAYLVVVDDAKKCVVLSIRGTYAATDVLTDLQPHSEKFEGGYAHSGILSAARWILENENDNLQILLSENPGYKMILTGHSLGAGAACLLTYLLRESVGSRNKRVSSRLGISSSMIECWGFGCPPCVDKELCESAPFIKNIVLQDDIIARASIAALEDLRSEILETNWADVLEDGGIAKKMVGLVNTTNAALGNVERALGYQSGTFYQQAKNLSYAAMVESFRATASRARPGSPGYIGPPGSSACNGAQRQYFLQGHYGPSGPCGPPMHYGPSGYYGQYGLSGYHTTSHGLPPNRMQGPRSQNLAGWISYGVSAINSYLNTPGDTSQPQGNTSLEAVSRDFMEGGRLFVPGVLYHVKRTPVEVNSNSAPTMTSSLPGSATATNRSNSSENVDTADVGRVNDEDSRSNANAMAGTVPIPMRHFIIKASNPQSRFTKIVLSKSLLSDHSLVSYKDSITDAIKSIQEV